MWKREEVEVQSSGRLSTVIVAGSGGVDGKRKGTDSGARAEGEDGRAEGLPYMQNLEALLPC